MSNNNSPNSSKINFYKTSFISICSKNFLKTYLETLTYFTSTLFRIGLFGDAHG